MKAFEIIHNGKKTVIGTKSGLLTVVIEALQNKGFIDSRCTEFDTKTRKTWHKYLLIKAGDTIEIKMVSVEAFDTPTETIHDNNITQPKSISKLEEFQMLETIFKEKGLL